MSDAHNSSTAAPTTPDPTPVRMKPSGLTGRSIAPDLARGVMLLLIAIANSPFYLWTTATRGLSTHPVEASELDRIVQSISLIAIDGRTYPMFALLFGYGIWQLYSRQLATGVSVKDARRLLRRRHWWMLAFGAVHAILLWMGDVVGAYGLAGLLLVWIFLGRSDKTLKVWAIVLTSLLAFGGIMAAIGGLIVNSLGGLAANGGASFAFDTRFSIQETSYPLSMIDRFISWLFVTPTQGVLGLVVPIVILVAILAARARVLEKPTEHLPLLRRTAVLGIGIGWVVGAVIAAQNADIFGVPADTDWAFGTINLIAGMFCGIGYVALFGLIAAGIQSRGTPGRFTLALQAVGKRSLSCYLLQSVFFAPVMSAWGLGLGEHVSSWSITLYAIVVWALTIVFAVVLERAGKRGPAEWALRRLAYPKPTA